MNRGTAIGMLLPLLQILERDPSAVVMFLPSDHYVQYESVLRRAMRDAADRCREVADQIVLLGLEPKSAATQLGYIVPCDADHRFSPVQLFCEKPTQAQTKELIRKKALWNTFIVAARGQTLLRLLRLQIPDLVDRLERAVQANLDQESKRALIAALHRQLPTVDFSRDVLPGQENRLLVLRVPACGWSDLGTPERVGEALRRAAPTVPYISPSRMMGLLVLANQYQRRKAAAQTNSG